MGSCYAKRNKFESDDFDEIKKVIDIELIDLQKDFNELRQKDEVNSENVKMMFNFLLSIQLLMNFSNLMEENKAFIIKNIETRLLIIKQIRKFQNIRENNFKPEENFRTIEKEIKSIEQSLPKKLGSTAD